ncbi:MAG: oxidoreductase [SAR324 cluster bacterium]|uniref:Oxidoreductase n=1 Tax=SAR324 cluster bacterium TaxID=2024889 RepID=A0A2A4T7R9_9DELT|nr:MAG: oxidoreductase [SAR324 cluster bacterium]
MNIAIIGYGYWGPNLVRNFSWLEGAHVKYVCDLSEDRLSKVKAQFPNVEIITSDYQQILDDDSVDAIAISTPVNTHYSLAQAALEAGKHVLVEKPMTDNVKDARALVELAEQQDRILMVDHTFLYTGAVKKIKSLIDSNEIGEVLYFDSVRVNLGLFQTDVNVLWDLAPHDISIMSYLIDKKPVSVSATGVAHVNEGMENIAYMTVFYEDNTLAHFHVNWLSPIKVRQIMIGGSEKMIVYDDMQNTEKVKVYDKGVDIAPNDKDALYKTLIQYRTGDMFAPKIDETEALKDECQHFLDCIQENKQPISNGRFGLEVVKMLEASQLSIKQQGKIIELDSL